MSAVHDVIDVSAATDELCRLLGIEPSRVAHMTITPRQVEIVAYAVDKRGEKYARPDGEVATVTFTAQVRT